MMLMANKYFSAKEERGDNMFLKLFEIDKDRKTSRTDEALQYLVINPFKI